MIKNDKILHKASWLEYKTKPIKSWVGDKLVYVPGVPHFEYNPYNYDKGKCLEKSVVLVPLECVEELIKGIVNEIK